MKCLMSFLVIGGLMAASAAARAADKSLLGSKIRGNASSPIQATLGPAEPSAQNASQAAPAEPLSVPAEEARLVPPQPVPENAPHPMGGAPMPMAQGAPVPLFDCVKYRHEHEIHPCAVDMIVSVKDPCSDPCDASCAPKCVNVKVCAPPCGIPKICCSKDGSRVKYDYGKYEFEIVSRKGVVTVKYDD